MYIVSAKNYSEEMTLSKKVKTILEAKNLLIEWNDTLDDDWDEMSVLDLSTGIEDGWMDFLEE